MIIDVRMQKGQWKCDGTWLSYDYLMIISWLSHDYLMIIIWLNTGQGIQFSWIVASSPSTNDLYRGGIACMNPWIMEEIVKTMWRHINIRNILRVCSDSDAEDCDRIFLRLWCKFLKIPSRYLAWCWYASTLFCDQKDIPDLLTEHFSSCFFAGNMSLLPESQVMTLRKWCCWQEGVATFGWLKVENTETWQHRSTTDLLLVSHDVYTFIHIFYAKRPTWFFQ